MSMKLFVWSDPYPVKYGSSMVFAIAESEVEARKQAEKGLAYKYCNYAGDGVSPGIAKKLGEPDRIVDVPCAEWHEWSE